MGVKDRGKTSLPPYAIIFLRSNVKLEFGANCSIVFDAISIKSQPDLVPIQGSKGAPNGGPNGGSSGCPADSCEGKVTGTSLSILSVSFTAHYPTYQKKSYQFENVLTRWQEETASNASPESKGESLKHRILNAFDEALMNVSKLMNLQ